VLSTVATYLPPPEPLNSVIPSFLGSSYLSGSTRELSGSTRALSDSTGAKTKSYRSLSTAGPVSSIAEKNSRFYGKFEFEEVGFV